MQSRKLLRTRQGAPFFRYADPRPSRTFHRGRREMTAILTRAFTTDTASNALQTPPYSIS